MHAGHVHAGYVQAGYVRDAFDVFGAEMTAKSIIRGKKVIIGRSLEMTAWQRRRKLGKTNCLRKTRWRKRRRRKRRRSRRNAEEKKIGERKMRKK